MLHIQIVYWKDIDYFYTVLVKSLTSTETVTPIFILQIYYF